VHVIGFGFDQQCGAVSSVKTSQGEIRCDEVVVAVGPWVRDIWHMLEKPDTIEIANIQTGQKHTAPMWHFWQLEEGVLEVDPGFLKTNAGDMPPVMHVDTDAPLHSITTGKLITDQPWGIYYKPDFHFNGIQGGAMPYAINLPADEVAIDPYGPASPQFVASKDFQDMWTSALSFCHARFEHCAPRYRDESSGGIGCFTPDSFPVFDRVRQNCFVIADSNHGYKMIGVGKLVAEELLGQQSALLEPFRLSRFGNGKLHPVSNSPFPWS
jgi:glycine/D-amino acid oxidase-like deaminating enzyme